MMKSFCMIEPVIFAVNEINGIIFVTVNFGRLIRYNDFIMK